MCSQTGIHPGIGIFDHETLLRRNPQLLAGHGKNLRIAPILRFWAGVHKVAA